MARKLNLLCLKAWPSKYNRINSTKPPASGAGNIGQFRLMLQVGESARSRVRVYRCGSGIRAVVDPEFVCLRSNCNHVTGAGVQFGMWDPCWRLSRKMMGTLWMKSCYTAAWEIQFLWFRKDYQFKYSFNQRTISRV